MEILSRPLVLLGVIVLAAVWLGPILMLTWNRFRYPAGTRAGDDARSGKSWLFAVGWTLAPPVFYVLRDFL